MADEYVSQSARDARDSVYGDRSYWDYLDKAERENHDMSLRKEDPVRAAHALTRTLSEALQGNDGI